MDNPEDRKIIDLSKNDHLYKNLEASACGKEVLIVFKLDEPVKRSDGKRVSFCIEWRTLTKEPTEKGDEVRCVYSSEVEYWTKKELGEAGFYKKHSSLFDCFNLF
jgi:hypothetical protein